MMPIDNTMRQPEDTVSSAATLAHARLVMSDGNRYAALTNGGTRWMTPAAGCLLRPAVGDWVLVSISGDRGFILTVLERAAPDTPAEISAPGDLQLSLPQGRLMLNASQGIGIDAGDSLDVAAGQLSATLQSAAIACHTLQVTGHATVSQWETRCTLSGQTLDIATQHETHAQQSVQRVTGHAEIVAQSLRHTVDHDWAVCADTADLRGRDRVTVQGDAVQLG